jgi:hypothetical protein
MAIWVCERTTEYGRSPSYAIGMHRANIAAQRPAEVDPLPTFDLGESATAVAREADMRVST